MERKGKREIRIRTMRVAPREKYMRARKKEGNGKWRNKRSGGEQK